MSEQERDTSCNDHPAGAAPAVPGTDKTRRRLTAGGLAGAGILMTMSSRSALGQTVGACGSESVSAALSRQLEAVPCGCSPTFWWSSEGQRVWGEFLEAHFPMTASFNDVFGTSLGADVPQFFKDDDVTLFMAKRDHGPYPETNYNKGNVSAYGMHAVAALLNVQFYGDRYPADPPFASASEVIMAFQEALRNEGEGLDAFKDRVDVYNGTWCFSGRNWREYA